MRMFVLFKRCCARQGSEKRPLAPPKPLPTGIRRSAMTLLAVRTNAVDAAPSKFMRLTDTMLFLRQQWAKAIYDESAEDIVSRLAA